MPFNALGGERDQIWQCFTADGQPSKSKLYRLDTDTTSNVQAAHIHQHAVSGNDDPRNGLALTPDAHWMFDAGLWTAAPKGDHFLIRITHCRFTEFSPIGRTLAMFDGHPLHFHKHARLRPAWEYLEWHGQRHSIEI